LRDDHEVVGIGFTSDAGAGHLVDGDDSVGSRMLKGSALSSLPYSAGQTPKGDFAQRTVGLLTDRSIGRKATEAVNGTVSRHEGGGNQGGMNIDP
jgi:hypothetical protein